MPSLGRIIAHVSEAAAIETAVELIDDAVYVDDADWTDAASKHLLVGGLYQSTPQTITDGDVGPLEVDTNGKLITSNGAAIKTAVELVDDAVYVDDADWTTESSKHMLVGGVYQSTPQTITDGDVGPLEVSSTGDLLVTLDGESITSSGITISQTPTITAGAYSAGDVVGGLLTFANAARVSGAGGILKNVIIVDDAGQDVEMELWLFNQSFTPIADNGAWAPAEADLENFIGVITSSDGAWFAAGTPSVCHIEPSMRFDLTGTSLFGQLVTRGTPTFAATDDVTVKVALLQD